MQRFPELIEKYAGWRCVTCDEPMVPAPVQLEYLESVFDVELPVCPKCKQVIIPEELAMGKMLDVERLLEDK
ncbi:DVU_1557 family redox protein [Desulfovibrio inopinatus]|uniref:DVU_1557 family redox protein n=1 Tax=Desulfovibrio inopinatus TaxID=102109 RepID=UPI000484D079|nr:CLJU_RS11820 family redox protein [Desulfovibrio inopinatus]